MRHKRQDGISPVVKSVKIYVQKYETIQNDKIHNKQPCLNAYYQHYLLEGRWKRRIDM